MRGHIVPIVIAAAVLAAAVLLFIIAVPNKKTTLGAPRLMKIADLDGIETEASISPDGSRCAVVVSDDVWLVGLQDGARDRITTTAVAKTFPSWFPDGRKLSFTAAGDAYVVSIDDLHSPQLFKPNAAFMTWSAAGPIAFVRDRALWLADADGSHERRVVEADVNPDIAIRSPRFSPDSTRIAFIKSTLNLRGEVWMLTLANGNVRPIAADRPAENPMSLDWISDGREIVYLTNRSGAYALWRIGLREDVIEPLTVTLTAAPLAPLGISTWKDRIVVPRHFVDSDIVLSGGGKIAATADLEFEPAASQDGKRVAYTVQKDTRFEIWTAGIDGANPVFRAVGREARFSPNGQQLVYTNTDPSGNEDVWRIDLRNSASESVTDAHEIDMQPDWSPDARTIAFASARGGAASVWTISADGGKRLRLNDGGLYPRFISGGSALLFWNKDAFWTMDSNGGGIRRLRDATGPAPGVWTAQGPKYYDDPEINAGARIWPVFDILPDGRRVIAPVTVQETSLWSVDLTYVQAK